MNIKLNNSIQSIVSGSIKEIDVVLVKEAYTKKEVYELQQKLKEAQIGEVAKRLRKNSDLFQKVAEGDLLDRINELEMKVARLWRAWCVAGKNPKYHWIQQEILYKKWKTLHAAIIDLVY